MTPEIRNLLKEARTIIRAHARWTAKDWDERATKALANPPQRTWVGLTDEDIGDEYVRFEIQGGFNKFEYAVKAIEAKLKEKNT